MKKTYGRILAINILALLTQHFIVSASFAYTNNNTFLDSCVGIVKVGNNTKTAYALMCRKRNQSQHITINPPQSITCNLADVGFTYVPVKLAIDIPIYNNDGTLTCHM